MNLPLAPLLLGVNNFQTLQIIFPLLLDWLMIVARTTLNYVDGMISFMGTSAIAGARLRERMRNGWHAIPLFIWVNFAQEIIRRFPMITAADIQEHEANVIFRMNIGRGGRFSFRVVTIFYSTNVPNFLLVEVEIVNI